MKLAAVVLLLVALYAVALELIPVDVAGVVMGVAVWRFFVGNLRH